MCAGEFLEAYANDKGRVDCDSYTCNDFETHACSSILSCCPVECWDCIVTCFFIDAAPNVIEYIAAFERLLKPGGYWINLGPLLYHWQNSSEGDDERYEQSVELSYEEMKHVMSTYNFRIQKESQRECLYTDNVKSMMKTVYNCVFFTAVKETGRV